MQYDIVYNMDCLEGMRKLLPPNSIDLTVTSPPYDKLRKYGGYEFNFEGIAQQLYRVTKPGGVVVWIVGDETIDGSESGESFRQALYFKEIGFKLHDTMFYEKAGFSNPSSNRYHQVIEFMFVFVKPEKRISKVARFDIPFSKLDAVWLAAMIDGEGCLGIMKDVRNGNLQNYLVVVNTNRALLEKCRKIVGAGNINLFKDENEKHRTRLWWRVNSGTAAKIIVEIYPYLIAKKEQAKVLLAFQDLVNDKSHQGKRLTEENKLKRIEYYNLVKSLNQKELINSGLPEPDLRVILKGKPKTFNPIKDRIVKWDSWGKNTSRQKDGTLKLKKGQRKSRIGEYGMRFNIWRYATGAGMSTRDRVAYEHPAIFPEKLAEDHILSWSNEGETVQDPMCGSGTTLKMAIKNHRHYIGFDTSAEYVKIARKRISEVQLDLISRVQ